MVERFSASVASRHMACHASANLPLAIPNWVPPVRDPTAGAKGKGTRMHEILEKLMELGATDMEQMIQALTYAAALRRRRQFKVLIEETVKATWLLGEPNTTADLVLFTQDELHILDWKWGKIPVEVIGNKQLLFYAACYAPLAPKARQVTVHVVQPPAKQMEEWTFDTITLKKFMAEAIATEAQIMRGDVTFGPSDNCTFCPANPHSRGDKGRPLCPVMMRMLYPDQTDEAAILAL